MKKNNSTRRGFWAGMITMLVLVSLVTTALAVSSKSIEVTSDVTIYIDGEELIPKDANGNTVETFIYNGTTYIPLRAVGEAFNKEVEWDGSTRSVYIGTNPDDPSGVTDSTYTDPAYFIDVIKPYQSAYYYEPKSVTVQGKTYTKSFYMERNGYAYYNLNGEYTTMSFDVGHRDGYNESHSVLKIYLDGEIAYTINMVPSGVPSHYDLPLNNALQMKIEVDNCGTYYAVLDPTIE